MSSDEGRNCEENQKTPSKKIKFTLQKIKNIRKLQQDEIFDYIEKLHEILKKNEKKLKKYKEKLKNLVQQVEEFQLSQPNFPKEAEANLVSAPVVTIEAEEQPETKESASSEEKAPLSLVDEIRQAAEQAQNLNGFVYEPTSGLYYDQKTGYYYNAEYGLYYDGNTGCYYNYNQEKNSFEFHSQVQAATKTADDNDIFDKYVNNALLNRFSKLNIDKMRKNALETVVADDGKEEWGVISDRPKTNKSTPARTKSKTREKRQKRKRRAHRSSRRRSESNTTDSSDRDYKKRDRKSDNEEDKKQAGHDMEDGELESSNSSGSDSYSNSASDADEGAVKIFSRGSEFQDIAKKYPPSLRIIVQESQLDDLKVGSLSLITFKGGTLGREGKHDVIIPDVNVSKFHLKFTYDTKKYIYKCIDLGSRNGTILNGTRMSTSKMESEPYYLVHGSVLQLGQTKLLCHVHEGNSTCGQCEPGLLIEASKESTTTPATVALTRKEQLKKIQRKYGLENEKFVDNAKNTDGSYNDRAATRRIKVGSSTDKEKTQTASVNTAISSENKGFKMLSKLGWSKGESLGKTSASGGLLEPINVSSNEGKKGLGCEENPIGIAVATASEKKKFATWKKTQERYQKADIFHDSDDDDSN